MNLDGRTLTLSPLPQPARFPLAAGQRVGAEGPPARGALQVGLAVRPLDGLRHCYAM